MTASTISQAMQIALGHHQAGRLAEAERIYRQVLAGEPNHVDSLHFLGVIAHQVGRNDQAAELIRRALQLKPHYAEAWNNLAVALEDAGLCDQAESACRRAIELKPDYAEPYSNLGKALKNQGSFDEAIAVCRRAIELKPGSAESHYNLGVAQHSRGQLQEAIASCRRALELKPNCAEALLILGTIFNDQGHLDDAIAAHRQAVRARPDYAEAHSNLGALLKDQGKFAEAIDACRHAIELDSHLPEAHWNLSLSLLSQGDFARGWEEFEWRWKCKDFPSPERHFRQPQWKGEQLAGRTILLHAEQGLGDTIQFLRYIPMVVARGGKVVMECQPELFQLLKSLGENCRVVPPGQALPQFDLHCPLMSLPLLFATRLESIPNRVPYLSADAKLVSEWATYFDADSHHVRVGIAWAGKPTHSNDRNRSMELSRLNCLLQLPATRFYSLQKGAAARQVDAVDKSLNLIDFSDKLADFAETAALIAHLDLLITVDTAVAHLAGAMGKPVWVLLPRVPDWRWLVDRQDSPWYPTMRLFHQKSAGSWDEVIARVAKCLETESRTRSIQRSSVNSNRPLDR
jgi:Tfp pilus assembly protein PilF